jgi:hypothetical protein
MSWHRQFHPEEILVITMQGFSDVSVATETRQRSAEAMRNPEFASNELDASRISK